LTALTCLSTVGAVALLAGCESHDHEHTPPAGQGAIVVDNHAFHDLSIFVSGVLTNNVDAGHDIALDLAPGVYRIALDEDESDRSFSGDIDVLEGQLTILDVTADPLERYRLNVSVYFD
jgi:hypothetical protein